MISIGSCNTFRRAPCDLRRRRGMAAHAGWPILPPQGEQWPPRPHAPRQNQWVENKSAGGENPSLSSVEDRGSASRLGYYSDWAVFAKIALRTSR